MLIRNLKTVQERVTSAIEQSLKVDYILSRNTLKTCLKQLYYIKELGTNSYVHTIDDKINLVNSDDIKTISY